MQTRNVDGMVVSPLALGTMRFADKGQSKDELIKLFEYLYHELGINIHHSSYEYNSYPLYCDAVTQFKKKVALH